MKKFIRWASIALCSLLLVLYFTPDMVELRRMPKAVSEWTWSDSALLWSDMDKRTTTVRSGSDERLHEVQDTSFTVSLFGILPIKTVTVVSEAETVHLGGAAVGVVLYTDGVQVVGLGSIQTENGLVSPASNAGLKRGDTLLKVNGVEIQNASHFSCLVNGEQDSYTISGLRNGEPISCIVYPAYDVGTKQWRLGAWVRDSTSGVGTLSFFDSDSKRFAALGHAVTDIDTGVLLQSHDGVITLATVFDVEKGRDGTAGELLGSFSQQTDDSFGRIDMNTNFGIGGTITDDSSLSKKKIELARATEISLGSAMLYATVEGEQVRAYECNVIRADVQSSPQTQGMIIEVTDEELIERTGGIVQGMSGCPVVQNGKLIGVVTHVFVNEPKRGYCLYAEWMYKMLDMG